MASQSRTDAILPMTDEYMEQIVRKEKTYEFRRYRINPSVQRVWFYVNAPFSHIAYICEIDPARTRNEGDEPLPENGLGNREFNERHKDWEGYDYAYGVRSVRKLREVIPLKRMQSDFGVRCAPRGLIYTPTKILAEVPWVDQPVIWEDGNDGLSEESLPEIQPMSGAKRKLLGEERPEISKEEVHRKTSRRKRFSHSARSRGLLQDSSIPSTCETKPLPRL